AVEADHVVGADRQSVEVRLATTRSDLPGLPRVFRGDQSDGLGQVDAGAGVAGRVIGSIRPDGEAHQVDGWPDLPKIVAGLPEQACVGGQQQVAGSRFAYRPVDVHQ